MIRSFKLVIRDSGDTGKKRQKPTPNPHIIEANIDNFLEQWRNIEACGIKVLTEKSQEAIEKLLVHVRQGCLSDIPVSGGTSRNECLHKILNKTLRKQKIGVQAAVALLGKFFYKWNEKKENKMSHIIMPVEKYFLSTHSSIQTTEKFGVKEVCLNKEEDAGGFQVEKEASIFEVFQETEYVSENENLDEEELDIHSDAEEDETSKLDIGIDQVKSFIAQASNKTNLIEYIKSCGQTELFEHKLFTSLPAALCLLRSNIAFESSTAQSQLEGLKETYNLVEITCVAKDLYSLFFEEMREDFTGHFVSTEGNNNLFV